MEIINKYGIKLIPVETLDACFIISIRTDEKKQRFISATNEDIEKQIEWINSYKLREKENKEFYFIAVDEDNNKFATYRIYNISNDTAEIGSWVTKPDYNKALNSIKVDLIMKEYVFENLGFDSLIFEVRKENKSVLRYHKMFGPKIVKETEDDVFFVLAKEVYYKNRNKLFKNIN